MHSNEILIWGEKVGCQMPCPFTGPKMFCASPNILSQPRNLTAFSDSTKNFFAGTKNNFTECKSSFCLAPKIWTSQKHFGTCKRIRYKWLKILSIAALIYYCASYEITLNKSQLENLERKWNKYRNYNKTCITQVNPRKIFRHNSGKLMA